MSDVEKKIVSESPDFDNQRKILDEEKKIIIKRRRFYALILGILLLVVLIFIFSYSYLYTYRKYKKPLPEEVYNNCHNVNIAVDSKVPNINIAIGDKCVPKYNIDYYNNRVAMFNIDLYGDRSYLFNEVNQTNSYGICLLNCDFNEDGWPDYNIDLNGDGKADLNIIFEKEPVDYTCDLNCDINYDTIADTNIDTNGDGVADVNITSKDNYKKALYNVDYLQNRKPTFNIQSGNDLLNPVNDASDGKQCTENCDLDNDGFPDYNIKINDTILNELIDSDDQTKIDFHRARYIDYKCIIDPSITKCDGYATVNKNTYINIDVDGDGKADVNISSDGGMTLTNEINKDDGTLNVDINDDGFPDYNIDLDNDGNADINIVDNNNVCVKSCDYNYDGRNEHLVDYAGDSNLITTLKNINIDIDYDGKCDVNCDTNYDLLPDYNIDMTGDNMPDINIDYDHDGKADFNIDTNHDGKPDNNISVYGDGICNFNCSDKPGSNVSTLSSCTKNCDTNNDGYPDKNVDVDNDGICDFNCDNDSNKADNNNDYFYDSKTDKNAILMQADKDKKDSNFYIYNPVSIKASDIDTNFHDKYVLYIKNDSSYAICYDLYWSGVKNEFTSGNLKYFITRNNSSMYNVSSVPSKNLVLGNNVIIRANTTIKYILDLKLEDKNYNQIEDSGKVFKGKLQAKSVTD